MKWIALSCLLYSFCSIHAFGEAQVGETEGPKTQSNLSEGVALFQKGAYAQALDLFSHIPSQTQEDAARLSYWRGLCLNRLQVFDQAAEALKEARPLQNQFPDLQYELGQALYASQQFNPAREAFKRSAYHGYKIGASYYYVGFISQILEDYKTAIAAFKKIQTLKGDPDKVQQASLYQLAEIRLIQASADRDPNERALKIREKVIPAFRDAALKDMETAVARQAQEKVRSLQAQVELDSVPCFRNGVPIPARPWSFRASENIKYDSNVLTRAGLSLIEVSHQGSPLSQTEFFGKYDWASNRRWSLAPEIDFTYTRHTNRSEPLVYQNDNLVANAAFRARREHLFRNLPAAFNADLDVNLVLRDINQSHRLDYFSYFYNLTFSERLQLFNTGPTVLSANFKLFRNADLGQNAIIPAATLTQLFQVFGQNWLSASFTYNHNHSQDPINYRSDYRTNLNIYLPEVFFHSDLNLSFTFTFVDTMNQRPQRGFEKTISPVIGIYHTFAKNFLGNITYSYTNNISLDLEVYAYVKHVFGLGILYQL